MSTSCCPVGFDANIVAECQALIFKAWLGLSIYGNTIVQEPCNSAVKRLFCRLCKTLISVNLEVALGKERTFIFFPLQFRFMPTAAVGT